MRFSLRHASLLLFAVAALGGCMTPSVHPIATADREVSDERIVGAWLQEDGKITYTVTKADEGYRLHVGKKAEKPGEKPVDAALDMRLVQLGAHRFIDVSAPGAERHGMGEKHGTFFIPTHMFARVEVVPDGVTVWWMKAAFLRQAMTDKSIAATPLDDKEHGPVLITAETEKLQAFLRTHAENDEAWEKVTLTRVKSDPAR
ncbi:MAG: hypothetical protein WD749_10655 [Phycisphaerales bacterium]